MPLTEREQIHHQLLQALGNARKQVERLEAALAHNAAFLGTGVEREDQFGKNPDFEIAPDALIRYLELVVPEADISDYIGSEGHDATRPRLGEDAPDAVRPKERRVAKSIVRLLAEAHPDDGLPFPAATVTLGSENSPQKQSGPSDPTPPEEGAFAAGPLPKTIPPPAGPLSQTQNRPAALSQNNGLSASPRSDPLVNPASEDGAGYSYLLEGSRIFFNAEADPEGKNCFVSRHSLRPLTDEDCLRAYFALQAIDDGIWDWNLRTGEVYASARWEVIAGPLPTDALTPLDTLLFGVHSEERSLLRPRLEQLLQGKIQRVRMLVRLAAKEESRGRGLLRVVCLNACDGPVRITAALADALRLREWGV